MSFILDALRKSEAERQREAVPTVVRAPLAPPRRHVPVWSWTLMGALSVAIVALGIAWWQSTTPEPSTEGRFGTSPAAGSEPAAGASSNATTRTAAAVTEPPSRDAVASNPAPPPAQRPPSRADQSGLSVRSLSASAPSAAALPAEPVRAPAASADAAVSPRPIGELSVVDPSQPAYRLDLLAYHADPARAYARINGAQYVPGQRLPGGPTVSEIRRDGVVLSHRGESFLLRPR